MIKEKFYQQGSESTPFEQLENTDKSLRLPKEQFTLLVRMFNNHRILDKRDNCFQVSARQTGTIMNVSHTTINRLFTEMVKIGIIKDIVDNSGIERTMIKPEYLKSYRLEYWFSKALYHLGTYELALLWVEGCWRQDSMIGPETGELLKSHPREKLNTDRRNYGS